MFYYINNTIDINQTYEPSDVTEAFILPANEKRLHSLKTCALTYFPWT